MRPGRTAPMMVALTLAAGLLTTACASAPEQSADGTWSRPTGWSDVSQNLLDGVYDKDPTAPWWGRITSIERLLGSSDNYIAMRINTDYRLNEPADVLEAANLCNALVTSIPREGWQVTINGIITEGITNADGSVETAENDRETITSSESWKEGYPPKYCEPRALFTDVIAALRAEGWTQQYLDDEKDPAKVFTDATFAQEGDIFFVDE